MYIWLPSHISENLIPEADLCSDWFLLLTNCCGSDSAICCQFTMYYRASLSYWGWLDGLCWKPLRVSCWGRLGFVLQKLLIVICGPITTYANHLNIFCCWLLACNRNCWTILLSLTGIILLVLHIAYLLADLIISVMKSAPWGKLDYPYCWKQCTLIQTWCWLSIQDSFCIQTRYSKFHCSLLITSFRLSELPSI